MKIDKSRFLLLTTTLAATTAGAVAVTTTACNITNTTDTDAGSATPGADAGNDKDSSSDGSTSADAGAACLGTTGKAPFCGPEVEGTDAGVPAKCAFECSSVSKLFKTGVAAAISSCLDTRVSDPTVEGACYDELTPCVEGALAGACDDSTAATYCTTTLQACGDAGTVPSQADCVRVVKALSADGRTALTNCTVESAGDCGACFDALKTGGL